MRRAALAVILAVSLVPALARRAAAQPANVSPPASLPSSAEPGAELRVFLMTFSDGSLIYEKFGHDALCIHDPNPSAELIARRERFEAETIQGKLRDVPPFNTTDRAYHYGAFDFEQENFVWRFLHGRMEYWMESEWADLTALLYAKADRSVLLQELDLSPAQRIELKRYLEWNERPENRMYRYDYYRDNCATRVRDAIDRVTGGELARQLRPVATGTTHRSHTRRVNAGLNPLDVFWFTSFTYVLGHPADEPLSAWDECFLPEKLAERVRDLRIPDGRGGSRPLVRGETLLARTTRPPMPDAAPNRPLAYGVGGILAGAAFAGLAGISRRPRRLGKVAATLFTLIVIPWALLWGVGAMIGSYGWAVTDHAAAYRNENLLQMTPLLLPLAVLGPTLAFGRRRGARLAVWLAVAGAALSVLGLFLKALPPFWQHNAEIIALSVPANVGLAVAMLLLARHAGLPRPTDADPAAPSPRKGEPPRRAKGRR